MKPGGGLLLALEKKAPKAPDSSADIDDEAEDIGFDSAFDDFAEAMKDGDIEGAKLAFKAAVKSCGDY